MDAARGLNVLLGGDPLCRVQQFLIRWPSRPQWKQGPIGSGALASIPSAKAWLAWGKRLLFGALVLDKSIGTWTLLYAGRGAFVELYCGLGVCC
jgi:hypothetical protein